MFCINVPSDIEKVGSARNLIWEKKIYRKIVSSRPFGLAEMAAGQIFADYICENFQHNFTEPTFDNRYPFSLRLRLVCALECC